MTFEVRRVGLPGGEVLVADSVTDVPPTELGAVAVTGSHGGETAIRYAISARLAGLIVNDAGVGCDDAGIAGLRIADPSGLAVAAVSHDSARIGDGEDTFESGVITHLNGVAASCGVYRGMRAQDAAAILIAAGRPPAAPSVVDGAERRPLRTILVGGDPPVVGLDSASSITPAEARSIIVAGSHGGLVGGAPLRHPVLAAVFNDAGIGKDQAGIQRLPRLDVLGIPGLAASHATARIGDAAHAYAQGRISHVNEFARALGVVPGQSVRDATAVLAARLGPSESSARPLGDPPPCHR